MLKLRPFFSVLAAVLAFAIHASAYEVPRLTGPVMDLAGMMSPEDVARVDQVLRRSNAQGIAQIQVLTLPSLNGEPIEEVSYKIVKEWKLGTEKADNGILFLVSQADRKLRIEVGQGLEGAIPDVYAKRIISDVVIPYFKQGQMSEGIVAGTASILELATKERSDLKTNDAVAESANGRKGGWLHIVIFLIFLAFIMSSGGGRGFLLGMLLGGGGRHGGGFGGGGFGGGRGGWSGGGGGFSGGGSSGSW